MAKQTLFGAISFAKTLMLNLIIMKTFIRISQYD
jgi:hypothetical protein